MRKMTIEEMEKIDSIGEAWIESYLLDEFQEVTNDNDTQSATESL